MKVVKSSHPRRGAALYISVMSTAVLVSLLGLAALNIVRIERRATLLDADRIAARSNADSAVELVLAVLANDPNWRTNYTSGVETAPQSLGAAGSGSLSWMLEDSDGNLSDADLDLHLKGIGRVGSSVQVSDVRLMPKDLTCLNTTMHAGTSFVINSAKLFNDQIISSNGNIDENGGSEVHGAVEAVGTVTGDNFLGTVTTGVAERSMPSAQVFDYYLANGTAISIQSLPKTGLVLLGTDARELSKTVISPNSNPFGATNPEGVYIIDCAGQTLKIRNCRIVGTIVLLNCGSDSEIGDNDINWEPAVPNFPFCWCPARYR